MDINELFENKEFESRLKAFVDDRIASLCGAHGNNADSTAVSKLKDELEQLKIEKAKLEQYYRSKMEQIDKRLSEAEKESSELQKKLSAAKKSLDGSKAKEKELEQMLEPFGELIQLYSRYVSMSGSVKNDALRTLGNGSILSFVTKACTNDGLMNLYRYISFNSDNMDSELLVLRDIYCMALKICAENENDISIIFPKGGEEYDSALHTRIPFNSNGQIISETILPGYMINNTKQIQTAIVRV